MSATTIEATGYVDAAEADSRRAERRKHRKDRGRCGMSARRSGEGAWRPGELVAMILGFVIFWPIGLAVLAWKKNWFGLGDGARGFGRQGSGWPGFGGWNHTASAQPSATGNSAFDAYRTAELDRLEAERRRLIEEEEEFGAFLKRLREAKDQEEFLRFMKDRTRA